MTDDSVPYYLGLDGRLGLSLVYSRPMIWDFSAVFDLVDVV